MREIERERDSERVNKRETQTERERGSMGDRQVCVPWLVEQCGLKAWHWDAQDQMERQAHSGG